MGLRDLAAPMRYALAAARGGLEANPGLVFAVQDGYGEIW